GHGWGRVDQAPVRGLRLPGDTELADVVGRDRLLLELLAVVVQGPAVGPPLARAGLGLRAAGDLLPLRRGISRECDCRNCGDEENEKSADPHGDHGPSVIDFHTSRRVRAPGATFDAYGRVSIRWLSALVSVYSSSCSALTWSQWIWWRFASGSTRYSGATLRPRMALRIVRSGPGALRVGSSTSPSSPYGSPYISRPFSVNSNLRSATISGCGEPYQRLSVPHTIRFGPTWLISLPSRCAHWSGSLIVSRHTDPSSAYT